MLGLTRLMRYGIIVYILFAGAQWFLRWKSYSFAVKDFKAIGNSAKGLNIAPASVLVTKQLRERYGPLIVNDRWWITLSVGGLPARALLYHASTTEFVASLFFPFSTSGFVGGSHWLNTSCTVIEGRVSRHVEPNFVVENYQPGDNFRHSQFTSHAYQIANNTHLFCYGRGMVPVSGILNAVSTVASGEPVSLAGALYTYALSTVESVRLTLTKTYNHYAAKATGKAEL